MHVCVSTPEAIHYIHVTLNLCNKLSEFATFQNVMIKSRGLSNKVCHKRNQPSRTVQVVNFIVRVILTVLCK